MASPASDSSFVFLHTLTKSDSEKCTSTHSGITHSFSQGCWACGEVILAGEKRLRKFQGLACHWMCWGCLICRAPLMAGDSQPCDGGNGDEQDEGDEVMCAPVCPWCAGEMGLLSAADKNRIAVNKAVEWLQKQNMNPRSARPVESEERVKRGIADALRSDLTVAEAVRPVFLHATSSKLPDGRQADIKASPSERRRGGSVRFADVVVTFEAPDVSGSGPSLSPQSSAAGPAVKGETFQRMHGRAGQGPAMPLKSALAPSSRGDHTPLPSLRLSTSMLTLRRPFSLPFLSSSAPPPPTGLRIVPSQRSTTADGLLPWNQSAKSAVVAGALTKDTSET